MSSARIKVHESAGGCLGLGRLAARPAPSCSLALPPSPHSPPPPPLPPPVSCCAWRSSRQSRTPRTSPFTAGSGGRSRGGMESAAEGRAASETLPGSSTTQRALVVCCGASRESRATALAVASSLLAAGISGEDLGEQEGQGGTSRFRTWAVPVLPPRTTRTAALGHESRLQRFSNPTLRSGGPPYRRRRR